MPPEPTREAPGTSGLTELEQVLRDLATLIPIADPRKRQEFVQEVECGCDPTIVAQLRMRDLEWATTLWNARLRRSLEQDRPRERILCGFNAFVDVGYRVDSPAELGAFKEWVRAPAASGGSAPIRTRAEILGSLLKAFRNPDKEWKLVLDESLWGDVQQYLEQRKEQGAEVAWKMGGASGNMAHVLRRLGLDTAGYWPYNSNEMAQDAPEGLKRLVLGAREKHELPGSQADSDAPVRRSFVFEFSRDTTLDGVKAEGSGRLILLAPKYVSEQRRNWERMILRSSTPEGSKLDSVIGCHDQALGQSGWPFFPVFASRYIDHDALVVQFADDDLMKRIAEQFDYFLLGGIQSIGDPLHALRTVADGQPGEPFVRTIIKHTLARQLRTLADGGVVIHWEMGGISSPQLLDDLRDACRGSVKSAALNHEELESITQGPATQHTRFHMFTPPGRKKDMLWRYDAAVHLARQFDFDQLYIHGTDADLVVRRRTTRGALRQEIGVILYAKAVVWLSLLQRSVRNLYECVTSAKPEVRLTAEGFVRLLELAKGLASRRFPEDSLLEKRTFTDILESGYYYERDPEEYSVIVVPVMWPELRIPFSTAGAGDVSSSVVAVYSGV